MSRRVHGSAFQYFLVAVLAFVWGVLGRVALGWFLRFIGFHERPGTSLLRFAIGPISVWAGVAIVIWTPFTQRLRTATISQSLKLGGIVLAVGTVILYALFVFHMGVPASVGEILGVFGTFPIFVVTTIGMGGFLAVPVTLATAVFFRRVLRVIQPPASPDGAA